MDHALSRRLFVKRSFAFSCSSLVLGGCGGGTASPAATSAISPPQTETAAIVPQSINATFKWKPLRIGAGGYVTGLDIAPDGTKVVRCDSAGAFIWSNTAAQWVPLLSSASMPTGTWGFEVSALTGVYEIAIAPSNSNRIYVAFNGSVFRTDNKGASFTKTALSGISTIANDDHRFFGRKMAVDPRNPDIVVVGSQTDGLFLSRDGGMTWSRPAGIPKALTAAGMRVAFDQSAPVRSGNTSRLYVSSQGNGVYLSSDGGDTFVQTSGGPLDPQHMVCDQRGIVWATEGSAVANVRKFSNGSWTRTGSIGGPVKTITVNPANADHIVTATFGGSIAQTHDGGRSWTDIYNLNYPVGAGRRVATDIPWLAWTNEAYMSSGEMCFDPSASNKLYFAEGIGVWWANPPADFISFDWTSQSVGIEQLVSTQFLSPPNGKPLYLAWDRPIFRIEDPDSFPKTHGPSAKYSIIMGWSADYALDDPKTIVSLINNYGAEQSGISTDGGITWVPFATLPIGPADGKIGGSIAAGGKDNYVWVPNNNGVPSYTTNRGLTWTKSAVPGTPTADETGWGWAYYLHRQIVVADKVKPGTFYLYNYRAANAGLYRSVDGGANFTKVFSGEIAAFSSYNATLSIVPGREGHLFFTSGVLDGVNPASSKFMRSTDGGTSWTEVPNMLEVYACGFGAPAPGQSYPAIYVAGYYKNVWGIWRSDNNAVDWTNLGANPLNIADEIKSISGDADTYGKVYVGFGGSGAVYGSF